MTDVGQELTFGSTGDLGLFSGLFFSAKQSFSFSDRLVLSLEVLADLVLSLSCFQRGADQTQQGFNSQRPLDQNNIWERLQTGLNLTGMDALRCDQKDRQLRPGGLIVQLFSQQIKTRPAQGFERNK